MHVQLGSPSWGHEPLSAVNTVHGRNVSAAPHSHRDTQEESLGGNSWATFFLLFMWPQAIEFGQTFRAEILQSSLSCSTPALAVFSFFSLQPQDNYTMGKSRRHSGGQRRPEHFLERALASDFSLEDGGGLAAWTASPSVSDKSTNRLLSTCRSRLHILTHFFFPQIPLQPPFF